MLYLQTDGNRIYKDLRVYVNAVRGENSLCLKMLQNCGFVPSAGLKQSILLYTDMREASRRLSQSLFDVYESDWAGEEDLGAIVEVSGTKKKTYCSTF